MSTTAWVTTAALAALAWGCAVPLTHWFARTSWTSRAPAAALVAWQAIGLSAGLAVLSGELTLGRAPSATGVLGLTLFSLSVGWLVGVLMFSFVRAARSRRGHLDLLRVLSDPDRLGRTTIDVIDAAEQIAYSVPGRAPHVVVSRGTRESLDESELRAVVAHEWAHLRLRHNLLIEPFVAWERSLPFLAAPRVARRRVEELVEMQCDDVAGRSEPAAALASALEHFSHDTMDLGARTARLRAPRAGAAVAALLLLGAALLVLVPPALLVVLG